MLAQQKFMILAGVASFFLLVGIWHSYSDEGAGLRAIPGMSSKGSLLRQNIHALFSAIRHPMTEDYKDVSGTVYKLPEAPRWTKPLGKRVLIVDIDTRVPEGEGEILGDKVIDWEKHQSVGGGLVSNGIMDHYLFAQIHGYDYKYYHAKHIAGHYDTWILPHILAELLPSYDFVISFDADVTVTRPEVGFEWLFNRWNVTTHTSISLPWDIEEQRPETGEVLSTDSKGVIVFNTGLVVVQNLPLTFEMLRAWGECPTEKRYKGCAQWKTAWSHEQRAFSEYIRYDFNPQGDNIVPIPCDDAMSWPGATEQYPGRIISDCRGTFFRHHTLNKQMPKQEFTNSVMQMVAQMLQEEVREDREGIWINEGKRG
ncbi:hypothetical protein K458DRAFT_210812 [Lentithecium fluviatile CBS 122367]|uniref:Glycosyltransferase family 34 protein n=1 Tax=Lentithecium fluviatile CBS 122367 TaxID=1168545 RepID=A0A6G1J706_9PLEO|nr:hypothetical protein K458DRAFT_210812 [Lentithecium fluviatile CBS 122367]